MAIQFNNPAGYASRGRQTDKTPSMAQNRDFYRSERAVKGAVYFIQNDKQMPDKQSWIQKSLGGKQAPSANSTAEALAVLQKDAPKIYKEYQANLEKVTKRRDETQQRMIPFVARALDELIALKEGGAADDVMQKKSERLKGELQQMFGTDIPPGAMNSPEDFSLDNMISSRDMLRKAEKETAGSPIGKLRADLDSGRISQEEYDVASERFGRTEFDAKLPTQSQQTKINESLQELDTHIENIDRMLDKIKEDPSLVGAVGSIRKGAQTTIGVIDDLTDSFPVVGSLKKWARSFSDNMSKNEEKDFGHDPNLSELRIFENDLAYALARARHPSGRIPVITIEQAIKDTKLTGLTSRKDVVARITEIKRKLHQSKVDREEIREGETPSSSKEVRWEDRKGG